MAHLFAKHLHNRVYIGFREKKACGITHVIQVGIASFYRNKNIQINNNKSMLIFKLKSYNLFVRFFLSWCVCVFLLQVFYVACDKRKWVTLFYNKKCLRRGTGRLDLPTVGS